MPGVRKYPNLPYIAMHLKEASRVLNKSTRETQHPAPIYDTTFLSYPSYDLSFTDKITAPNALSELKAKFKSLLKGGKKSKKPEEKPAEAAKPAEPTPATTAAPTETAAATEATPAPAPAGNST
jgi:cell division septation protein DedD